VHAATPRRRDAGRLHGARASFSGLQWYEVDAVTQRVRYRGQVNRRRVELLFSGDAVPEPDTLLTLDGKEVGYVTRAARTWDPPRILGMGYARKEATAPGTVLHCASGTAAVMR